MGFFSRMNTDHQRQPVCLEGVFTGSTPTACWILGGGPSLATLPVERIAASPIPKFSVNLSGSGLIRPNFWTSYDPSARFHRSIYLDGSILKFVHRRRAMDLVPETTCKVCDCPGMMVFDRDARRGFSNWLAPDVTTIGDWADSLMQAIEIAYRLGFRVLLFAGCEMRIAPSEALMNLASQRGVPFQGMEALSEFLKRCEAAGLSRSEIESAGVGEQYHFDEEKVLTAAVQTDLHYYRVSQYLRLARRHFSDVGLQLISTTPHSRLNDYFPYESVESVIARLTAEIGEPGQEATRGLYTGLRQRTLSVTSPMKDFKPPQAMIARQNPRATPEILVEKAGWEPVRPGSMTAALRVPVEEG